MSLTVHILSHDHEPMTRFAVRHYRQFSRDIIIHDGGPLGIENLAEEWTNELRYKMVKSACAIEIEPWDTGGELNDALARQLKNECWRSDANGPSDWSACVDADELLYFPGGAAQTLARYTELGAAMIRPHGFEMFSDALPPDDGQITDHVKMGAPDDKWYGKPVLFRPCMVSDSGFGIGAHEARPVLKAGRALYVGADWPKADPPTLLLHYHQLGTAEQVAERYDATRRRLSLQNVRNGWGNIADSGIEHVRKKRALILPNLRQVIP